MSFSEFGYTPEGVKASFQEGIKHAQRKIGDEPEQSLIPPSLTEEEIFAMPLEEIQKKFARRYDMFKEALAEHHRVELGGVTELSEEQIGEFRKWIVALNSLDTYIQKHYEGEEVTLKDRQLTVFEDIRSFLEANGREGYVKLPTGVGKTVLFIELIEALNLKTLIVVPKQILVEQTKDRMEEFAPDVEVGRVYAKAKQFGRNVTIVTYDSLVGGLRTGKIDPSHIDCLILDEVHESLSDKRRSAIKEFGDTLKIGFTATPEYSTNKKVKDLLPTEIHAMDIKEAVEENLLCSFSSIVARTEVDLSNVTIASNGEYTEAELQRAVNILVRNKAAVELYKKKFDTELAIAYCAGVEHAETLAKLFNEQGIPAAKISGTTPNKKELFKKFHDGEIKVLCNADLLITGFDEKKASVCLNLRPTRSQVVAEQRGGRVLRIDEKNEEKFAYVIDFIDQGIKEGSSPILFADVVDGVIVMGKEYGNRTGGGGHGPKHFTDITIEGLEIIIDSEEIMRIVSKGQEQKGKEREKLTLDQLKKEVENLGIRTSNEYAKISKGKLHWPAAPNVFYKDKGWTTWPEFLGTERISLEKLKEQVRANGIVTSTDYVRICKTEETWPSDPSDFFKDKGWISWPEFLGTEKLTFEQLKKEIRAMGIADYEEYRKIAGTKVKWPVWPDKFFKDKGWISWPEFLGTEKLSLEKLKGEVQALGISKIEDYQKIAKTKPCWPAAPYKFYQSKGWVGWYDLFGKEKREEKISLDQLKKEVRALGIVSVKKYIKIAKTKSAWPANPHDIYKDKGWISWPDLFGKEAKLDFEQLKSEIQKLGITTWEAYSQVAKTKPAWPAVPNLFYKGKGWISWRNFTGKED